MSMSGVLVLGGVWLLWTAAVAAARLMDSDDSDPARGLFRLVMLGYSRIVQRLAVSGEVPAPRPTGRVLLIVANHTTVIDPIVVQAALPYEVRWVMGADMATPLFERFWRYARVILVDRTGEGDSRAQVREAINHLKRGGVLGVFPEGFIERPPRTLLPFQDGVGLFVTRSGALVVPVVIEGTPQTDPIEGAFARRGRVKVRFLPAIDYREKKLGAAEIAADLRRVFKEATGWPTSEHAPKWQRGRWVDLNLDGTYKGEERTAKSEQ